MPSCRSSSTGAQYNAGEEIEISITAPYTGSGLITIERDKVYAHHWFKTDAPAACSASACRKVSKAPATSMSRFIRALDSKEIFMSPLSYGVVPFTANNEKRRLKVDLQTRRDRETGRAASHQLQDRPAGEDRRLRGRSRHSAGQRLQDCRIRSAIFSARCALRVETAQIVDLIMPEFSVLRSASAFGGDGERKQLNPFKRVTEKPVVFWSGIVDADATEREVIYDVPDYFSGTLTVMAVAVARRCDRRGGKGCAHSRAVRHHAERADGGRAGRRFEVGVTVATTSKAPAKTRRCRFAPSRLSIWKS